VALLVIVLWIHNWLVFIAVRVLLMLLLEIEVLLRLLLLALEQLILLQCYHVQHLLLVLRWWICHKLWVWLEVGLELVLHSHHLQLPRSGRWWLLLLLQELLNLWVNSVLLRLLGHRFGLGSIRLNDSAHLLRLVVNGKLPQQIVLLILLLLKLSWVLLEDGGEAAVWLLGWGLVQLQGCRIAIAHYPVLALHLALPRWLLGLT
jgi:hypothetical protein